nr:MAG TPA: Baseplate wedge protein [Caudoviricetes sp.]
MSSIIQNKFHEILGDAARTTKFTFVLPPISGNPELMNHLVYSVKALTLPTMEHTPFEFKHKGQTIPIRGQTKFSQSFTVTFYLSETHILKRFFSEWMASIEQRHFYYNPRKEAMKQREVAGLGNEMPQYMTWYNTTAYIEQWDFDGMKPTAVYEIHNVFPIRVEAPSYSYDSVGQIAEFTVTFACSHYMLYSKALKSGQVQNQLFHTTNRWAIMGQQAERGKDYVRYDGEYWWDEERYREFNSFLSSGDTTLDQTAERKGEVYWRPGELARGAADSNHWNRWREINEGVNRDPNYDKKLKDFDYDELEDKRPSIDNILQKSYKQIPGDFGYNGDTSSSS